MARFLPQPEREVAFTEFRQLVRRYRPSDLLPALAAIACRAGIPPYGNGVLHRWPPWAIALIARESILWGNEYRKAPVDESALRGVVGSANNIFEREVEHLTPLGIITQLVYDQFPYQESDFEELTRTLVMLVDGQDACETKIADEESWVHLLGGRLDEAVAATFFLWVGAQQNGGWFKEAFFAHPDMEHVFKSFPEELARKRLDDLTSTFEEFRESYRCTPKPRDGSERYRFNPLTKKPFVMMPNGERLAPQPRLILRTVSPGGLYYAGIEAWGNAFAEDLGTLTEAYVGRQLASVVSATVAGEVRYKEGAKSIDWFMVLPSVVVLIEVESARLTLRERAADAFEDKYRHLFDVAVNQINRSHRALESGRSELSHIPPDRPRLGVVVTAEPFYVANSDWARQLMPDAEIPMAIWSMRDLEMLVALRPDEVERHLLQILNEGTPPSFNTQRAGARAAGYKEQDPGGCVESAPSAARCRLRGREG